MLDPDYGFASPSRPFIPNPLDKEIVFDFVQTLHAFELKIETPVPDVTDSLLSGWLPFNCFLKSLTRRQKEDQLSNCLAYAIDAISQFEPDFEFNITPAISALTALHESLIYNRLPQPRTPISTAVAETIKQKFSHTCSYCKMSGTPEYGPDGKIWNIDHIKPVSRGGTDSEHNLCLSCWTCNSIKGPYHRDAYRSVLSQLPDPLHLYIADIHPDARTSAVRDLRQLTKARSQEFEFSDDVDYTYPPSHRTAYTHYFGA